MTPTFDKVHTRFKLNGKNYNREQLRDVAYSFIKEGHNFEKHIGQFLNDWLDSKDYIKTKTSGSTGKPKIIKIKKQAMVNSAIVTGNHFSLKPGNKVLLCLPANAISGKMILVRAMILGLELDSIEPKAQLQINRRKTYHFGAMIPLQLQENLEKISNFKQIIVGGAAVSNRLISTVQYIPTLVYETYGMTETVSHIAIKPLNKKASVLFEVLPNVIISKDERDCLVISAPHLSEQAIVTNDIVKIHDDKHFEWLGRFDHVINSGGVKLFPEVIEAKLQEQLPNRFFITSVTDKVLGEKVVLVIEGSSFEIDPKIFKTLHKHEVPKDIFFIKKFLETPSGKFIRSKTLDLIL